MRFLKSGDGRTDDMCEIVITTDRDCGSASWTNCLLCNHILQKVSVVKKTLKSICALKQRVRTDI